MTLFSRRTAAAVLISAAALPSASSFQATSVLPLRARSGDAACTAASMSVDTPRSNLGETTRIKPPPPPFTITCSGGLGAAEGLDSHIAVAGLSFETR
jgi:hypothetical protein